MLGREMKDMFMRWIGEKRATQLARLQLLRLELYLAQVRHRFANLQAPVRIQIVQNPVEASHLGEVFGDFLQVGGEIDAGPRWSHIPDHFPRGHDKRSSQGKRSVPDVFLLASLGFTGLGQFRGVFAFEDLHARLLVRANQQPPLFIEARSADIQPANFPGLRLEIRVMAVQPIDTPVRFEIGVVKDAKDCRSAHGLGMGLVEDGRGDVVQAPAGGGAAVIGRFAGGDRDHINTRRGGKTSVADRTAERPANPRDPAASSDPARGRLCDDYNPVRPRFADWAGNRGRRPVGPPERETQRLEVSNRHELATPTVSAVLLSTKVPGQKGWAWRASLLQDHWKSNVEFPY